jgi:alanine-glyoxylate transaminase/serine-glyoxylate transaminase/serine-pyruvate transaminase
LFASHLANTQKPVLELNTPFSVERTSSSQDHAAIIADESRKILEAQTIKTLKELDKQEKEQIVEEEQEKEQEQKQSPRMSTQEPHAALLIPGPIEFDDAVLQSMSHFSESHVGMPFVKIFGESLSLLRKLFQTSNPASQPFIIAGSGTLGWDQIASNLTEPGDDVLVLHTGYFADSFAECFEAYGANATQLKAPIGDRPQQDEVEKALKEKKYKIITITHVDTSTGVLSEIKSISELVHRVSPETLVIVDGVCSAGSEEIRFDDWGLDVVMTASQKGIGCPAGLSILMASERAIQTFKARTHRATSYFASWKNWMPSKHTLLFQYCSLANSVPSHAKLRSTEAFVLCYTTSAACTRSTHLADTDSFSSAGRPLCCAPSRVPESEESRRRAWSATACIQTREPSKRHDCHLSSG